MPQINVLKLDKGSSAVLKGLFLLVPSSTVPPTQRKVAVGGWFPSLNTAVLPNLKRIVLDIGLDETESTGGVGEAEPKAASHGSAVDEVEKYAAWRKNYGFPIEVVRR